MGSSLEDRAVDAEQIIVGAGLAGLACARESARLERGLRQFVLEKSRGVGGRCATRRVAGRAADHGLAFFHGSDARFLATLDEVGDAGRLEGWPARVRGAGHPCQPRAYAPNERRVAFARGVTALPKHLALGLDVRRESRVVGLAAQGGAIAVACEDGSTHRAPRVVLALPALQAHSLLQGLHGASDEIPALAHLLGGASGLRCLTAIVVYASATAPPDWDLFYPDESRVLHLASHDSAKRESGGGPVLVLQALPAWSLRHWDAPRETWSAALLDEAARLLGAWVSSAEHVETHRWRYARAAASGELAGPVVADLTGGARLGLAGEIFAPGGGAQAAFRSGTRLATRLSERRTTDAR